MSQLKHPFEFDKTSITYASSRGISVKAVRKDWKQRGKEAAAKGTAVHEYISNCLDAAMMKNYISQSDMPKERFLEMSGFDQFWADHKLMPMLTEQIVGDRKLGLAGTVDAVFGNYDLYDWKTGKFTFDNKYKNGKLKPPFADLSDCHYDNYSLQVSCYRLIIERTMKIQINNCFIVHFPVDGGYKKIRARDFRDRIENWLLTK